MKIISPIHQKDQQPPGLLPSPNHASNSHLFCSLLPFFFFYSFLQSLNESVPLMNAESREECGGGRVKTTEHHWSLKVRYERDVAEQALSLCYTAGSVTTDCSRAPLLFSLSVSLASPLRSYSVSSYLICFSLSPVSLSAKLSLLVPRFSLHPTILPFSFRIIVM